MRSIGSGRLLLFVLVSALSPWTLLSSDDGFADSTATVTAVVFTPDGSPEPGYGTTSAIRQVIGSNTFNPRLGTTTWSYSGGVARHLTSFGALQTTLNLPSGAAIEAISIRGCDTSTSGEVVLIVNNCDTIGAPCSGVIRRVETGFSQAMGCGIYTTIVGGAQMVDSGNRVFLVSVETGLTSATTFDAIYIDYKLRVSQPPATATFPNDVPTTHPFFRFIEALAAAGITSGCAPGSFCPEAPVTRGQMAVFLSAALGLHWTP